MFPDMSNMVLLNHVQKTCLKTEIAKNIKSYAKYSGFGHFLKKREKHGKSSEIWVKILNLKFDVISSYLSIESMTTFASKSGFKFNTVFLCKK